MKRHIFSISMPQKLAHKVRKEVQEGGYVSVSEYFRDLVREDESARILEDVRISRNEIKEGKGRVLRSLKTLR